jgi:hypothetical protein
MSRNGLKKVKRMAVEDKNREVVKTSGGDYIISSPDGVDSEVVSKSAAEAIAEHLQNDCRGFAEGLQTDCKAVANASSKPILTTCRPKTLSAKPRYSDIETLLQNSKYIQEISAGIFKNINEILETQKGLPSYIIDDLNRKGFQINDAEIRRDFLPLFRLKLKDKVIAIYKKINLILLVGLSISLILYFSKNTDTNITLKNSDKNEVTEFENTDSVCTYSELHELVKVYSEVRKVKIYPYSERIILERVNAKKINSVEGIKEEIEKRIKEL